MDLFIPLIVKNAYVIFTYDPVCFVLLPVSEFGNVSVPYAVNKIKATVCVETGWVSTGVVSTGTPPQAASAKVVRSRIPISQIARFIGGSFLCFGGVWGQLLPSPFLTGGRGAI